MKKKILTFLVAVCLIIPCILGFVACKPKETTANKTMKTSINPEITFSLDANNKVTSISYGNSDAGTIFANVNFVGKDASYAIQIVIEQSAISGHINLSGDEITFEFTGEDIEELKNIAEAKAKEVFEKLGVKVMVKIDEVSAEVKHTALVGTAQVLAPELSKDAISKMTDAELIELIDKKQKDYKDLAFDQIDAIQSSFNRAILDAIDAIRLEMEKLEETMKECGEYVSKEIKDQYAKCKKQLNDKIDEFLKERKDEIAAAKKAMKEHKDALIETYKIEVANAEALLKTHLDTAKENGTISEEQYAYWTNLINNNK